MSCRGSLGAKDQLVRWADQWAVPLGDLIGITFARAAPLDLRETDLHPLEAYYRASRYQPVLLDIPVSRLRGFGSAAFPCTQDGGHPFIDTLLEYRSGVIDGPAASALARFYRAWQPKNAAEYLGVKTGGCHEELLRLKPVEAIFPWWNILPRKKREGFRREVSLSHGAKYRDSLNNDWNFCGPVDDDFLEREFRRLVSVYENVRKSYYRDARFDGDITGMLMLNGSDWRVQVRSGHHRISALVARGDHSVPVRLFFKVPPIVRREDFGFWPHVVNGKIGGDEALRIFDRIFDGIPPWMDS